MSPTSKSTSMHRSFTLFNKVNFTILVKLAIYFIIPLPGGMTPSLASHCVDVYSILLTCDRSGCLKDFSPKTSAFLTKTKHTAMVEFHRKLATSIEAAIEFKHPTFYN